MKKLIVLAIASLAFLTGCISTGGIETPVTDTANVEEVRLATEEPETDIENSYLNANFRVLFVEKHPTEPYFLVVATDRPKKGEEEMGNNAACGSIYTQPMCYFFIEPADYFGAPKKRFVGTYTIPKDGETGAISFDSIEFTDKNIVEFQTMSGDAGFGIEVWWSFDIDTGELRELKREMKDYTETPL